VFDLHGRLLLWKEARSRAGLAEARGRRAQIPEEACSEGGWSLPCAAVTPGCARVHSPFPAVIGAAVGATAGAIIGTAKGSRDIHVVSDENR